MALIELGLIDGNYFNASHVNAIEAAINDSSPAGSVVMTVAVSAPTGWLMLAGQVIPSAQVLYPDLWAVIPASWKSGTTMTLPNATSRFPIGGGTVGTVGGASSKTIAAANLPVHAHSISMQTADTTQNHVHGTGDSVGGFVTQRTDGGPSGFIISGTGAVITTQVQTSGASMTHRHDINGNTGNIGSGTALDVTPAWIALNFMIRAY